MASTNSLRATVTTNSPAVITSFAHHPLTTTFSRPADCDGIYLSGFLAMVDVSSTCLPDSFKTNQYFSPGLICPSGYVSACHDATGVASITTVTCCPTLKNPDVSLGCVTASTLSGSWSSLYCTWIAPPSSDSTLPVTLVESGLTTTSRLGFHSPGGLNAFGIRMVYEASDLATRKTRTTQTGLTSISGGATTTNSPQDKEDTGGISTSAKIAIGVTIPVVVLAILIGAFFWWRRRRHRYDVPVDTDDKPTQPIPQEAELQSTQFYEIMDHTRVPVELPGSNPTDQPGPGKPAGTSGRWA